MTTGQALRVDGSRLWGSIEHMAAIGATAGGGVTRLTLSDEDRAARDLLASWCRDAGLELRVDRIGNMFARRAGAEPDLPPVLVGSHLDSQPLGGRFDGTYGVLAALEAVRTLDNAGVTTRHPVEIVNWTNEEATRYRPAPTGSGVFAGRIDLSEALAARDEAGVALGDELVRIGYAGDLPPGMPLAGYLEIHIEQGPVLERAGVPVGIVLGNFGVHAREITLRGAPAHIGTTPVAARRDALLGAAELIAGVRRIAEAYEPDGRATVARLDVLPNVRAIVAEEVSLTADCRHHDPAGLAAMSEEIQELLDDITAAGGLEHAVTGAWSLAPVRYDKAWVDAIGEAARGTGSPHLELYSGAIHDAIEIARVAPTGMIFVPSHNGLSHHEDEYTSPEDLEVGANVLVNTLVGFDRSR